MTRTGLSPDLCRHAPEPYVEIHATDAGAAGVTEGALTRVRTAQGEAVVVARISDRQRVGSIFMPMHWTDVFAPSGKVNGLVAARVDARSGQPEFKHTPARVSPYRETWRGFHLARNASTTPGAGLVWRRIPQALCQLHEFAGRGDGAERAAVRAALVGEAALDTVRYEDPASGSVREAFLSEGRLDSVLFTTTSGTLPPRDWLIELFATDVLDPMQRASLLIGRAPGRRVELSPVVCTCRNVRLDAVARALKDGAVTVDAVSDVTEAGSACGSCRPEIWRLIKTNRSLEIQHAA